MNKAILQANAGTPIQVAVLPTPSASLTGLVYHLTSDDKYYVVANGEWKVLSVDDYNMLKNLPIINQDLDATGFVGIEGAYYRHIGSSTNEGLVPGTIYRYQNDEFKELGAGASAGMQTLVGTLEKPLTVADFEFGIEYLVQGYLLFGNVNEDHIMFNIADASASEMGGDGGPSYTNGSIVLKQKGKKEENRDTWQHYLVIRNTYVSSVNEGGMTFNILPYEGFYFTVSFRSTEEGKTGEEFGLTFTQAGFPFVNRAVGGIGFESMQSVPDEENAYLYGIYAPVQPGEEGQVLNAVENGHFAPTWKDPAIKTLDLSKIKTISGNYYKHTGDGTKSCRYSLTPLGTLPNDKYRANTFITVGSSFGTIYFNQNVTPNPTELDWSNVTTDSDGFENLTLIGIDGDSIIFSRKLINTNYEYVLREKNNGVIIWIGEGTLKDALGDEDKAQLTSNGWKLRNYDWTNYPTITEVNQQDIWNSYISRYDYWDAYRSNFYVNTEIIPDRSTFILDSNDSIDDTHYIFYGDCGYMSAYKADGSRVNFYVTFFEIYTDYNKTNFLYYGLSVGDYENHLQYILYANTTTNQEPSVAGLTKWGWQYSKGSPILLEYSWGNSYDGMTPNWQNFFSEDDRWATPQDIEPGKIYYCDENAALVPLATSNDIQSLVGNINTLLESIDTGAGV